MSNHSTPTPAADHSHDDHGHDIRSHVRVYTVIFFALLVGTGLTVLASYFDLGSPVVNISVALVIATIKAGLVAGYFMHLISEKTAIYGILVSTAFFFVGLMALTLYALHDFPSLTHWHW